jgi:hypothetical protein
MGAVGDEAVRPGDGSDRVGEVLHRDVDRDPAGVAHEMVMVVDGSHVIGPGTVSEVNVADQPDALEGVERPVDRRQVDTTGSVGDVGGGEVLMPSGLRQHGADRPAGLGDTEP